MHILAGRYKGRNIKTTPHLSYRPTQSRIRKSLFDMLGDMTNLNVLDIYAGTGILGFEAASRGANEVIFVDNDYKTTLLLKQNSRLFPETSFIIKKIEAKKFLQSEGRFDVIIADPPYAEIKERSSDQYNCIIKLCRQKLKIGGRFVLETSSKHNHIRGMKEKIYGDTKLLIWEKQ